MAVGCITDRDEHVLHHGSAIAPVFLSKLCLQGQRLGLDVRHRRLHHFGRGPLGHDKTGGHGVVLDVGEEGVLHPPAGQAAEGEHEARAGNRQGDPGSAKRGLEKAAIGPGDETVDAGVESALVPVQKPDNTFWCSRRTGAGFVGEVGGEDEQRLHDREGQTRDHDHAQGVGEFAGNRRQ